VFGVIKQALRGWRLAAAAGVFITFSLLSTQVFGEYGFLKLRAQMKELSRLEQEVSRQKEENQRLEERVHKLRTDADTIEKVAREEMKLVRPGEVIYTDPAHK